MQSATGIHYQGKERGWSDEVDGIEKEKIEKKRRKAKKM